MNCREAQTQLFSATETTSHAVLAQHVAGCAGCRRIRDDLGAALTTWRTETMTGPVPDPTREWHEVRRMIRGGATTRSTANSSRRVLGWIAVPLGAAAALAIALSVGLGPDREPTVASPRAQVARADSVEVPGDASALVYVDDKSGWLIVWASDSSQI